MRILVTGGAGFIGANLVHQLIRDTDHQLLNIDKLTYAGNLQSIAALSDHPRHEFKQIDLCDVSELEYVVATFRPEAIMHLAAESHVDRSIDEPGDFVATNVVGTYNLLRSVHSYWRTLGEQEQSHFRFLHVSTDEVYGSLTASASPFTESSSYLPNSPYSATKASSDHLVRAWGETYRLPVLVTNCSNNYGPYQFPEKLIPVVILKALRGESIPVYGKGENVRDWLHVEDHCRGLRVVLEKGIPGETYNIGGDQERTNLDLARSICGLLDEISPRSDGVSHDDAIIFVEDRPGHDFRYAIDASKIRDELGWKSMQAFEQGLRSTITWYLENRKWWQSILDGSYRLDRLGGPSS